MTIPVEKQKKIDLACIILFPLGQIILCILALMGYAIGRYGDTYIATTHAVIAALVVIFPLLRYTRKFVFPYWFIIMETLSLYLYSIPLFLGFFDNLWWWDEFSHWYSSVIVCMIIFFALCIIQSLAKMGHMGPAVIAFLTFYMGFGFGCAWELYEGTVDYIANGDYMSYSILDTLSDVHMDFVGALTMGVLAYIILRHQSAEELVAGIDEQKILYNITHPKKKEGDD